MLSIVKSSKDMINIEKEIMDSNPEYNLLSTGREDMPVEDLLEEHDETEEFNKERFLVMKDTEYIGIIDFTMKNPKDQKPWIGLIILHRKYHGAKLGYHVYKILEELMLKQGAQEIRLGCYDENKKGIAFWKKQSYSVYEKMEYNGRKMSCYQKVFKA